MNAGNKLRRIHGGDKYQPENIQVGDIVLSNGQYFGTVIAVNYTTVPPMFEGLRNEALVTLTLRNYGRNPMIEYYAKRHEHINNDRYFVYRKVKKNRIPVECASDFVQICADMVDEFIYSIPIDGKYKREPSEAEIIENELQLSIHAFMLTPDGQRLFDTYVRRLENLTTIKFGEVWENVRSQVTAIREF